MLEDLLCCPQPRPTKSENCAWGHAPCSPASTIKVMAPWPNYASRRTCVQSQIGATNSVIRGCALLMAFTAWTEPALARITVHRFDDHWISAAHGGYVLPGAVRNCSRSDDVSRLRITLQSLLY